MEIVTSFTQIPIFRKKEDVWKTLTGLKSSTPAKNLLNSMENLNQTLDDLQVAMQLETPPHLRVGLSGIRRLVRRSRLPEGREGTDRRTERASGEGQRSISSAGSGKKEEEEGEREKSAWQTTTATAVRDILRCEVVPSSTTKSDSILTSSQLLVTVISRGWCSSSKQRGRSASSATMGPLAEGDVVKGRTGWRRTRSLQESDMEEEEEEDVD